MGSLRNPVGPLPSSIYWRRRAVALAVLALLAALIVWTVNFGGGDGGSSGKNSDAGGGGGGPAESITPGPPSSGPAISERPGGRDEAGGDGGGGSTGSTGGGDAGAGSGGGDDGKNGSTGGGSTGGSGGSGGIGVPAGVSLAECGPGSLELSLRSVKNTYAPDEKPEIELVAENTTGKACQVGFGTKSAVLTITSSDDEDPVWASDDCLRDSGEIVLRVPAGGKATYTVEWDRKPSEPECATPSGGSVKPGTYLVEAVAEGLKPAKVSFVLAKD